MKKILLLMLLVPVLCNADEYFYYELPGGFLGCQSALVSDCYENFDKEVRLRWLVLNLFAEAKSSVYTLEMRLYDKGVLWSEPLHWQDYRNIEQWDAKYLPIIDSVKFPEFYYDNQVQE